MKNIFMYGNNDINEPEKYCLYPYLVSQLCNLFSFKHCKFGVQKSKASTARIALWKIVNIPYVYTIESSFYRSENGGEFLGENDLMLMGQKLCEAILLLYQSDSIHNCNYDASEKRVANSNIIEHIKQLMKDKLYENMTNASDDSGSDSNPSENEITTVNMLNSLGIDADKSERSFNSDPKPAKGLMKSRSQVSTRIRVEPKGKFIKSKKMYEFMQFNTHHKEAAE